jgi:hypothetical protein
MPVELIHVNVVEKKIRPPRLINEVIIQRGLDDSLWGLIDECWSHFPKARPDADSLAARLGRIRSNPPFNSFVRNADNSFPTVNEPLASPHSDGLREITKQDIIIAYVVIRVICCEFLNTRSF